MENNYIVFIKANFLCDPRTIQRFHIFEFVSFNILLGSQMVYGVMGLWPIFQSCVYWVKCRFGKMSIFPCFSAIRHFGDMSFRLDVFQSYVPSVICLSAICLFGHLSFSNLSYHHYKVPND